MTGASVPAAAAMFDRICAAEERLRLFDHQLDGWCVWPIFRKTVADRLAGPVAGPDADGPGRTLPVSRSWRVRHAATDIVKLARLRKSPLLVKTYSSGLLDEDEDGRFRDIWFDDILCDQGQGVKLEALNSRAFLSRRERRVWPDDLSTALSSLVTESLLPRVRTPPAVRKTASELSRALEPEFGPLLSDESIRAVLAGFRWERGFYRRVLERVRPEVVLTADFGEYALCSVAKEAGIPVLELQHGVTDRFHPAYAWSSLAAGFRARMPVADRMLLYGAHWKSEMDASGYWRDRLDVVGSTRIDRWRARAAGRAARNAMLLVTAQGLHTVELGRILADCLAAVRGPLEIVIKLHPVFERANDEIRARLAGVAGVTILAASEGPSMLELLGRARLHASVSSAAHYEALALGTPTAVLALPNHETVLPLVERGDATLAATGADLAMAFERAGEVPRDVGGHYFMHGALGLVRSAIQSARERATRRGSSPSKPASEPS